MGKVSVRTWPGPWLMLSLVSKTRGTHWLLSKHLERTTKAYFLGYQAFLDPPGVKRGSGTAPASVHHLFLTLNSFLISKLFPSTIICMRPPLTSRQLPTLCFQSRLTPWCP